MSRAERLLQLMQALRCRRHPVRGAELAQELGISVRTLYRDIAALQAQGARIDGEPGIGYVLRSGFVLPPLMFSNDEIEALVLGSHWVSDRADARLADAARNALAKIASVLPSDLRFELDSSALLVGPGEVVAHGNQALDQLRAAIRAEHKLSIRYSDSQERESSRTVWPFALGFFDRVRVLVAWCELREEFRHFRTDRLVALTVLDERYPRRRLALLKEWRVREGIEEA
ncbi:YafY family protein [Burkholderia sp. Ac-20353]|uniref:helix-turn-helix transcriptional regulator n=1 Tax=Burkholderia sp. Ac-20353 TaxID=2703894 RepID=UPI00197C2C9A|nr:YafY family protein [Burkholderia sp. Ac-20353]MBN3791557.1 YafY family transcriptional regulator [Burkholderia sp. Ac-20353]